MRLVKGLLIAALAVSPLTVTGEDNKNPAAKSFGSESKAFRMSDKQLDQISAGTTILVISNPGGPEKAVFHQNLIQLMNVEGNGPTAGEVVIHNPARDRFNCIGRSC